MHTNTSYLEQLSKDALISIIEAGDKERKNFQYLLDSIHGINWEFDLAEDRFTYVSSGSKKILGYEKEDWTDINSWINMIHEDDRVSVSTYCRDQTLDGKDHSIEYRMIKKTGEIIWILDIITLSKDENNQAKKLNGFMIDITDKKIDHLDLQKNHDFLQNIIDTVPDPIMIINSDYSVSLMNKTRKKDLEGRTFMDPLSPKCYEISHYRDTPCNGTEHGCPLHLVLETKRSTKVLHNHKFQDGRDQFVELAASPLFDDDENCIGIIESARDITEHIQLTHELQKQSKLLDYQAHHDYLTGLPNRALFMDRLEQTIKDAKRHNIKTALFFIDLDHFKEVNDTLGHDMGDKVLKKTSQRLSRCIRDNDVLSRLGGDEFTIIMKDVKTSHDASVLAEKIIHAFDAPMIIDMHSLKLTTSIGISIFPDAAEISESLLQSADAAMYKAKEKGKNNFQFYK